MKDLGKIGWIAGHHHSVAFAHSFFSRFARGTNITASRMVKWIVEQLHSSPPPEYLLSAVNLEDVAIVCFTDASLSRSTGEAQLGVTAQLCSSQDVDSYKAVDNMNNLIAFKSCKYRRAVRSTGQAELSALSLGVDIVCDLKYRLESLSVKVTKVYFFVDAMVVIHQLKNPHKAEVHSRLTALTTAQIISDLDASVVYVPTLEQKADELTKLKF